MLALHVLSLAVATLSLLVAALMWGAVARVSRQLLMVEALLKKGPGSDVEVVVDLEVANGCRD
jgi:hypothetical protein